MLKIRLYLLITIVCFICSVSSFALANEFDKSITPVTIFDKFWLEAKSNIYPKERVHDYFTEKNYQTLKQKAAKASDIYELTPIINDFLEKLQVSHTHFFNNHSIDFYMFRSMFLTREISRPKVNHIGAQYSIVDSQYVVREVLDGYPSALAGIKRGDIILKANGKPFHPYKSFNPVGKNINLKVLRNEKLIPLNIDAVTENPNLSFYNAMIQSIHTYEIEKKKVGYVHLWSGTHKSISNKFKEIIEIEFHDMDAIILDLRGGFGGTWYEYLDPFFPDRNDFFEYTWINTDGEKKLNKPQLKTNEIHFSGPMVVLINEGVRSGKEALAYQFKKSNRAILIGTNTKGAFTAGRGIFNEEKLPYFLYLATGEMLLDGTKVEGFGISPDIYVSYSLQDFVPEDPQLNTAILEITKRVNNKKEHRGSSLSD
ncbi:MAG: PDZ domain-containing protein [Gammaproteobacteria bacterium]|nr:PDZ domain-containing protein [Gammaproteobacteria bacterium]